MPATLQDIQNKVRRLTRSLSPAQVSDAQINEYVNTFILYDFPEQLRLFSLRRTLTFYCQPFVDTYSTTTANVNDPLYQFKDIYVTVHEPVYIAGFKVFYSQSRTEFFGQFPFINFLKILGNGDGVTTNFNFVLPQTPFLANNVTIDYIDAAGASVAINDQSLSPTAGTLSIASGLQAGTIIGAVNYVTGAITLNLLSAPGAGQAINSLTVPYVRSRPTALLYFNDMFTVRPVPDQVYPINLECYIRPTQLINNGDVPYLQQWWQYIAYGAAKKLLEDLVDMESVALIMPGFKEQERLVLRTTLVQMQDNRSATIYTQQAGLGGSPGWWGWGNGYY